MCTMGPLLCKESQQGVYVILLTEYSMVGNFLVILSSFIPSSHVTICYSVYTNVLYH